MGQMSLTEMKYILSAERWERNLYAVYCRTEYDTDAFFRGCCNSHSTSEK